MVRRQVSIDLDDVEWTTVEDVLGDIGLHTEAGEKAALLSGDPQTGIFTMLVYMPPGFTSPAPEVHSIDQEEVILRGDFWLGDHVHRAPYYAFFPAGTEHGPVHTDEGCLALFVHNQPLDVAYRT